MNTNNYSVLSLINEGRSLKEISKLLSLSYPEIYQILNELKKNGYEFRKKIYLNGDLVYRINNKEKKNCPAIISSHEDTEIDFLIISDFFILSFSPFALSGFLSAQINP